LAAQSEEDKEPVTVDFSKMVAYLYGETMGQEDEAWFQGNIVGKTTMQFMGSPTAHREAETAKAHRG